MPLRHFTTSELANYRRLKRGRWTNFEIAHLWRRDPGEVDIALNALLGRTPLDAAAVLNHHQRDAA